MPFLAGLVAVGLAAFWILLILKTAGSEKMFPYRRRTPVPWNGLDVVMLLLIYLFLTPLFATKGVDMIKQRIPAFSEVLQPMAASSEDAPTGDESDRSVTDGEMIENGDSSLAIDEKDLERSHVLAVLILEDGRLWVLVLCFISATILAPICEEFLFRLLLQGYLEKVEWQARAERRAWQQSGAPPIGVPPWPLRLVQKLPYGFFSVLLPAVLFASFHYRIPGKHPPIEEMLEMMIAQSIIHVGTIVIGLGYLKSFYGVTWEDLGIHWGKIPSDIVSGITLYAICFFPLMGTQWVLTYFFEDFVPDPVTLVFFAWALGFLYFRKHSIVAPVAMHMALNLTSTVMLMLILFNS